jgi:hypothetical protein
MTQEPSTNEENTDFLPKYLTDRERRSVSFLLFSSLIFVVAAIYNIGPIQYILFGNSGHTSGWKIGFALFLVALLLSVASGIINTAKDRTFNRPILFTQDGIVITYRPNDLPHFVRDHVESELSRILKANPQLDLAIPARSLGIKVLNVQRKTTPPPTTPTAPLNDDVPIGFEE